jgi:hypothetical protein
MRRRRAIQIVLTLETAWFVLLAVGMLDVAAHRRDDPFVINQFGYRGPARASKRAGERRVMIVGGSAAFSAGTPWPATLGPALVKAMNTIKGAPDDAPFADVHNVAEQLAGADTYADALNAYEHLHPDVVVVYDGYDPVGSQFAGRRRSWVFRSLGYFPILFGSGRQLPHPEHGISPLLADSATPVDDPSCIGASASYCAAIVATARLALANHHSVVVVTPPYVTTQHRLQQQSLAAELARVFEGTPRFRYVNLGRTIDLHDPSQSRDGVHTTSAANRTIAQALARPIVDLLEHRDND